MKKSDPIGVFDSGIGGLSALKQFVRFLPYERYVYLGDTARVPYGNKSETTVKKYAKECVDFLLDKKVKLITAACNTVSSVALDAVKEATDLPIIDMISPVAGAALRASQNGNIGVIGTRATIKSGSYKKAIENFSQDKKTTVFSKECPLFVPLVEEGYTNHRASKIIAEEYLQTFKDKDIDALALGCTHYPLLKPLLSDLLPGVELIDSGEHAAVQAVKLLADNKLLAEESNKFRKKPEIDFYFTDLPTTFGALAERFLGFPVDSPRLINL